MPSWTICITTNGLKNWNASLFRTLPVDIAQVLICTSEPQPAIEAICPKDVEFLNAGIDTDGIWKPSRALYAAREMATGEYFLWLHDDCYTYAHISPEAFAWRTLLETLAIPFEHPYVGMTVPKIDGYAGNNDQQFEVFSPFETYREKRDRWFNTTEYVSSACFAIKTDFLKSYDIAWSYHYNGYAAEIQAVLAEQGMHIVVQPEAVIEHLGHKTFSSSCGSDVAFDTAVKGLVKYDREMLAYKMNWTHPKGRITGIEVDRAQVSNFLLQLTDDTREQICYSLEWRISVNRQDNIRVHYSNHPTIEHAINLTSARTIIDAGTYIEPVFTLGSIQSIPPLMNDLHLGCYRWTGLGDMIMLTAVLKSFHERYPHIQIHLYNRNWKELFITEDWITFHDALDAIPDFALDVTVLNGNEGAVDFQFDVLGLHDIEPQDRKMFYHFTKEEQATWGIPRKHRSEGHLRIGLQLHGGWLTKYWDKWEQFIALCESSGHEITVFGQNRPEDNPHYNQLGDKKLGASLLKVGELNCTNAIGSYKTVRQLACAMQEMDVMVGFDSGPLYLANASGIPTVWLFATHDPDGLIGICGANAPYTALWRQMPGICHQKGSSCRDWSDSGNYTSGGPTCGKRITRDDPHPIGADCLDEITPGEVLNAVKILLSEVNRANYTQV